MLENNNSLDTLLNTLLYTVKQYIYAVKCADKNPNLNEVYKRIYKEMPVEKYIAQKNGKQGNLS